MVRVVGSDPPGHRALASHLAPIMHRSSLYFAIGLRLLFVFPPYLLYLIGGPTWGSFHAVLLWGQGGLHRHPRSATWSATPGVTLCVPASNLAGPTTLLIATVVDLAAQLMFDVVEEPPAEATEEEKAECDGTVVAG